MFYTYSVYINICLQYTTIPKIYIFNYLYDQPRNNENEEVQLTNLLHSCSITNDWKN